MPVTYVTSTRTDAEVAAVSQLCAKYNIGVIECTHWEHGGAGAEALAHKVVDMIDNAGPSRFRLTYPDDMTLWDKVRTVAQNVYGAQGIIADKSVRTAFDEASANGFGHYPVCIAKTQYSFSSDPNLKGEGISHVLPIRQLRISGGSEFAVAICGDIMTMPGLPRVPAAEAINLDDDGNVVGLF